MGALAQLEERVTFSPNLPDEINRLLQAGVASSRSDKEKAQQLFRQAQKTAPDCLETYFALYKFYFYDSRLAEAEQVALMGLEEAARQGKFPSDWRRLAYEVETRDFYAGKAALFYLYTLKALAFIKLRQGHTLEARVILAQLQRFDPEDRSGRSVIESLASGLED
jgi:tetratricopeptide (TPR) repeat protein